MYAFTLAFHIDEQRERGENDESIVREGKAVLRMIAMSLRNCIVLRVEIEETAFHFTLRNNFLLDRVHSSIIETAVHRRRTKNYTYHSQGDR